MHLVGEKHARMSPTQICARTNFAVTWEQADCERGGHTFLTSVARNQIQRNKLLTGFRAPLLRPVPWVYLKRTPLSMRVVVKRIPLPCQD